MHKEEESALKKCKCLFIPKLKILMVLLCGITRGKRRYAIRHMIKRKPIMFLCCRRMGMLIMRSH